MLITPVAASAGPVEDLVNQVSNGVNQTLDNLLGSGAGAGGSGGGSPSVDRTPSPTGTGSDGYVPPAHGTNPHAQGTGAVVDLTPDTDRPLEYDSGGGDEEIVVGGSRGEQNGGAYHGHVSILTLLGNELIEGADTNEGETSDGPLGDLNALLADVCTDTSGLLCLAVLDVHSETTSEGSSNSFAVARAGIGIEGTPILEAEAVESEGNISDDGTCQTSSASSSLADAGVLPGAATVVGVDAAESSSESQACNDGTSSQTNDSNAFPAAGVEVAGVPIEVPIGQPGCGNGTPNSPAAVLGLIELNLGVCNADDSSNTGGTQNDSPFGVREGLTVLPGLLGIDLSELVKVTTVASETQAVAPPETEEPPPGGGNPPGGNQDNPPSGVEPGGPDECPDPDNPDCPAGPGGPGGPTAESPDNLPFTGADMLSLGLIGFVVMGTGLGLMALVDRRRRIGEQA